MKVIRDTPDQLIIANRPWLLGIGITVFILVFAAAGLMVAQDALWFGVMFSGTGALLGGGAFAAFVRRTQVILDRPSGKITIRHRSVFSFKEETLPLARLTGAELQTTTSMSEGRSRKMYRPVLMLGGGPHPIVQSYTTTNGPKHLVEAINTWLDKAQRGR